MTDRSDASRSADGLLHQRVMHWAQTTPDRLAIITEAEQLSYAELAARAMGLARVLVARGVGREKVVGVHLNRSPDAVVAMLGILQAGAAYLPLPTDHPADRLKAQLVACRGTIVIADHPAPSDWAVTTISPRLGGVDAEAPAQMVDLQADHLAYVIFTSGSSGTPKGVMVSHRSAVNLTDPRQGFFRFGHEGAILQLAPLAFDASAFEIWGALTNGATLVIPAPGYEAIDRLASTLSRYEVTSLLLTPALFGAVMDRTPEALDGVKQLLVGGDAMNPKDLDHYVTRTRRLSLDRLLSNVYGPTEATTLVSREPICFTSSERDGVPIGQPIHGATLQLLDEKLTPVGVGDTGEIYIGGDAVTRGYVGQPALTARSFLPDPDSPIRGARMYATGDRGRRLTDGKIAFVGRGDRQVKIRGYRIELGEIESALARQAGVQQAHVVVTETAGGSAELTAWVLSEHQTAAALRRRLATTLPTYMHPARIEVVQSLPLTASGKVDRAALTAQAEPLPASEAGVPMSSVEARMAEIWRDVLKQPAIGPDDDFFARGGDSMLAIRLIGRAERYGLAFTLADLFDTPTVRGISAALTAEGDTSHPEASDGPHDSWRASRLQLGLIYDSLLSGGYYATDVVAREVALPLRADLLQQTVDDLVRRHPVLQTCFDLSATPEPLQVVDRRARVLVELDDPDGLLTSARSEHEARIMRGLAERIDPEQAPLLRVHATKRGEAHFWIAYAFHHALLDGWSEATLFNQLVTDYEKRLRGEQPPEMPSPPFSAFVELEREALASDLARRFFTTLLAEQPSRVRASGRGTSLRLEEADVVVPVAAVGELEQRARELRVPVKSLAMAAFFATFAAHESWPLAGLSMNARPEVEGGDLALGLFVNHVPFRLELGDATWRTLTIDALAAERALVPHRRFPSTEIARLAGGIPYEVVLTYVHFRPRAELRARGLITDTDRLHDPATTPVRVEVIDDRPVAGIRIHVGVVGDARSTSYADAFAHDLSEAFVTLASDIDAPVRLATRAPS